MRMSGLAANLRGRRDREIHRDRAVPDGSTAETLVTVIGGHEEESESGTTTLDSDFLITHG